MMLILVLQYYTLDDKCVIDPACSMIYLHQTYFKKISSFKENTEIDIRSANKYDFQKFGSSESTKLFS